MITEKQIVDFVTESNRIEGILRPPTPEEITEFVRFMALKEVTVREIEAFVKVYQPDARLRDKIGLNVRVGNYTPPMGSPEIRIQLGLLLNNHDFGAWTLHCMYEKIHPFTDGNGRSGRALWAWKMQDLRLGFLHMFYYQTLTQYQYFQ